MKLLLDENLPLELRHELSGHDVFTVQFQGWKGVKNGLLLTKAAQAGFDAMITMDSGVPYQQNIATLPIAVIVLTAASNDIDDLHPLVPRLLDAIKSINRNMVISIE